MDNIHVGDIISTFFIIAILATMIVVIIRLLIMIFLKSKQPSTQNSSSLNQQVHVLTKRIQKLEQQVEELQKNRCEN